MSIIRSNIARQLLAEGGAPRKGFARGSTGFEGSPEMGGSRSDTSQSAASLGSTGFEGSPEMGGRGTTETYGFNQSDDTPQDNFKTRTLQNQIDYELGLKNIRNLMNPFAKPELPPQFYYNKDMFDEDLDQYGLSGKNLKRIENLQKGLDIYKDTGELSQLDFEKAFFGPGGKPPTGEGGDNEPIKKLRAPITEKKEEPKDEFADILKFYGARFARGGSTGFEGSPELGGQGTQTEETYGGPPGGDGGDNEPPTVRGGGTEPPMLPGGRGIDVGALQKQGLTPDEIAAVYGDYYGIDTTPTVAGPLGSGLGSLTPTAPAPAMGQQVPGGLLGEGKVAGTTLTQPTNLDDLRQAAEDVGRAISDPSSPFGQALDFGKAAVERSKMYEDVFKADGGEVRQEYGLGSIVKKIGRTVKKVAKSPIGKAALLGGLGFLGATKTGFGADLLTSFNKLDPIKKALLVGGTALTLSPFAMQDEEEEKLPTVANTDPEMTKFIDFYGGPRRFAAEGGMMEQDEMLDLGGKEMDLRGGGFVPLGEYEKKDDVPARLSKNEFVFTADAVRAAGGGSVDKGADVMYKTMKTLENKVV